MSTVDPNSADYVASVGLDFNTLKKSLQLAEAEMNASQKRVAALDASIALAKKKFNEDLTTQQKAYYDAFVKRKTDELNFLKGNLAQQTQLYQQFQNNLAKMGNGQIPNRPGWPKGTAAWGTNPGGAPGALTQAGMLTALFGGGGAGAGGGGGGAAGVAGGAAGGGSFLQALMGNAGAFASSFGFGLRSSGLPGARQLATLPISAGFGGGIGLAGAGAAVGLTAAIDGVTKLIELYSELAEKAADLVKYHDEIKGTIDETTDTVKDHFFPALQDIQDKEEEIARWFEDHQDLVGDITDKFTTLTEMTTSFVASLLELVTRSDSIDGALNKIAGAAKGLLGYGTALVADLKWMMDNPLKGLGLVAEGLVNPGSTAAGIALPAIGAGIKAANAPTPEGPGYISRIGGMDVYKKNVEANNLRIDKNDQDYRADQEREAEKVNALRAEVTSRQEALKILQEQYQIESALKDLDVQKEEALNTEAKLSFQKVDYLMKELDFQTNIADLQQAMDQKGVDKARAKTTGLRNAMGAYPRQRVGPTGIGYNPTGAIKGTQYDPQKRLELQKQIIEAETEEANAEKKMDDDAASSRVKLHQKIIELIDAETEENKKWLDSRVADLTLNIEIEASIIRQASAIKELNNQQRGLTSNAGVSQVLQSQFPNGLVPDSSGTVTNGPLSPEGIQVLQRTALQYRQQQINSAIGRVQDGRNIAQAQLDKTSDPQQYRDLTQQIQNSKDAEASLNQELIKTLVSLEGVTQQGTPAYEQLQKAIDAASASTVNLGEKTLTWGEAFQSSLQTIISHASAFNSVIGNVAGNAARVGSGILGISNVHLLDQNTGEITAQKAGSITSGLGAAFGSKKSFLTQGLPMLGEIGSAVAGVIQGIHDLFTAAAKKTADQISKDVGDIVSSVQKTGKLEGAINDLQAQRDKAVTQLSSRKGGQAQLDTLLPQIDQELESIKQQQKDIVDSFTKSLSALSTNPDLQSLIDKFSDVNKTVTDFINAAGDSQDTYAKAFQYIEGAAGQMSASVAASLKDTQDAFYSGIEDDQGNMISVDEDAHHKVQANYDQYVSTMNSLEKQRAELTQQNSDQEADDLKSIASLQQNLVDLQQQLIDLNDQEAQQIKDIQNDGIAVRQKTTQETKAQQIADLQDQSDAQKKAILDQEQQVNDQLDGINKERIARQTAYEENITNIDTEEAMARTNMDNTYQRILNETQRAHDAFTAKMADYNAQQAKILELEDTEGNSILAVEALWQQSLDTRAAAYTTYIDNIIAQNEKFNTQGMPFVGNVPVVSSSSPIILNTKIDVSNGDAITKEDVNDIVNDTLTGVVQNIPVRR